MNRPDRRDAFVLGHDERKYVWHTISFRVHLLWNGCSRSVCSAMRCVLDVWNCNASPTNLIRSSWLGFSCFAKMYAYLRCGDKGHFQGGLENGKMWHFPNRKGGSHSRQSASHVRGFLHQLPNAFKIDCSVPKHNLCCAGNCFAMRESVSLATFTSILWKMIYT